MLVCLVISRRKKSLLWNVQLTFKFFFYLPSLCLSTSIRLNTLLLIENTVYLFMFIQTQPFCIHRVRDLSFEVVEKNNKIQSTFSYIVPYIYEYK